MRNFMNSEAKQIGAGSEGGGTPSPLTCTGRPARQAGEIGSALRVASPAPSAPRCGRGRTERIRPRRKVDEKTGAPAMQKTSRTIVGFIRRLCADFAALPARWNRELMVV